MGHGRVRLVHVDNCDSLSQDHGSQERECEGREDGRRCGSLSEGQTRSVIDLDAVCEVAHACSLSIRVREHNHLDDDIGTHGRPCGSEESSLVQEECR